MKYIIEFDYNPDEIFSGRFDFEVKEFLKKLQENEEIDDVSITMHEEVK